MRALALAAAALVLVPAALASTAATPVSKLALTAAEVGPGFTRHIVPGGTLVEDQVTLDMCGGGYPSEALRKQRLQVAFAPPAGQKTGVSNEVVRYTSASGAAQALREVKQHIAHCPKGPVAMPEAGAPKVTFRFQKLSVAGLLPGSVATVVHLSAKDPSSGRTAIATTVAIYQVKGDVLSGIYTDGGGSLAAQAQLGAKTGKASAAKLKRLAG